jgi:putative colanic acid biosynthesis UDP-glucose lipid carrier transferase
VHTGVDDFGMVMVEALAAGKPVLACAEGGALDIVRDGETGILIDAPTVESVRRALDRFERGTYRFDATVLRAFAKRFDRANFERRFAEAVDEARDRLGSPPSSPPPSSRNGIAKGPADLDAGVATSSAPATAVERSARRTKRVLDVALAASGLVATAPLVVGLGILISVDSPGPALFYQKRAGRDRIPFTLVKLRTMDSHGNVTPVGRFLRPTGLDELPQLWNVLKGDMSLIGPRPEVFDRIERHERNIAGFARRYAMRPGITGWAQVNGLRGDKNISLAERLRFDVEYIREWSLALDGRILLRTLSTVLRDTLRAFRA